MPYTHVGLIARLTLPAALTALAEAAAWLEQHGLEPVVEAESAFAAGLDTRWRIAARGDLADAVDVVLAFGGDGTLLDAAGLVAQSKANVPVLGVNLGHLGFLTEVGRADLVHALEALRGAPARLDERVVLRGRIERDGQTAVERLALNDIVVTRGAVSRMVELEVTVDEQVVCHVKADGLIVATATGSTAYNLSAGGPIVHPAVDAFVLTPIAPHTLTHRPLVLPATMQLCLRPSPETAGADIMVTFDGQFGTPLRAGDQVIVERAPRRLRLLRVSARSHFDMLREKLKWGNG